MVDRRILTLGLAALLALPACRSEFKVPPAWKLGGQTAAYHHGPLVAAGETGPRRFLIPMLEHLSGSLLDSDSDLAGWSVLDPSPNTPAWKFSGTGPTADEGVVLYARSGSPAAASLARMAHAFGTSVAAGEIPGPSRSLILQFTNEAGEGGGPFERQNVVAEFFLIGTTTGPCTLWRCPDPGGADIGVPASGLSLITRLALVDVGMACRPWKSEEWAHDQGPDHRAEFPDSVPRIYLAAGESGVDLARTDRPDVGELDRAGLALWSSAAAVAGARPTDLDRYLSSILLEARLRHFEAQQAGVADDAWQDWLRDARLWLRSLVLGLPISNGTASPPPPDPEAS